MPPKRGLSPSDRDPHTPSDAETNAKRAASATAQPAAVTPAPAAAPLPAVTPNLTPWKQMKEAADVTNPTSPDVVRGPRHRNVGFGDVDQMPHPLVFNIAMAYLLCVQYLGRFNDLLTSRASHTSIVPPGFIDANKLAVKAVVSVARDDGATNQQCRIVYGLILRVLQYLTEVSNVSDDKRVDFFKLTAASLADKFKAPSCCVLGARTGIGKTWMTIDVLVGLRALRKMSKGVIFVPTRYHLQWTRELRRRGEPYAEITSNLHEVDINRVRKSTLVLVTSGALISLQDGHEEGDITWRNHVRGINNVLNEIVRQHNNVIAIDEFGEAFATWDFYKRMIKETRGFLMILDATPDTYGDDKVKFYKLLRVDETDGGVPLEAVYARCVVRCSHPLVANPAGAKHFAVAPFHVPSLKSKVTSRGSKGRLESERDEYRFEAYKALVGLMGPDTSVISYTWSVPLAKKIHAWNLTRTPDARTPDALNVLVTGDHDNGNLSAIAWNDFLKGRTYRISATIGAGARGLDLPPNHATVLLDSVTKHTTIIQLASRGRCLGGTPGVLFWLLDPVLGGTRAKVERDLGPKMDHDWWLAQFAVDEGEVTDERLVWWPYD